MLKKLSLLACFLTVVSVFAFSGRQAPPSSGFTIYAIKDKDHLNPIGVRSSQCNWGVTSPNKEDFALCY